MRARCVALAADLHARLSTPVGDVSMVRQMVAAEVGPHVTEERFRARGIEVPVGVWRGRNLLRVSVAPCTTHEDLDRLLSALYQASGSGL